jgi:hypothetical protein
MMNDRTFAISVLRKWMEARSSVYVAFTSPSVPELDRNEDFEFKEALVIEAPVADESVGVDDKVVLRLKRAPSVKLVLEVTLANLRVVRASDVFDGEISGLLDMCIEITLGSGSGRCLIAVFKGLDFEPE